MNPIKAVQKFTSISKLTPQIFLTKSFSFRQDSCFFRKTIFGWGKTILQKDTYIIIISQQELKKNQLNPIPWTSGFIHRELFLASKLRHWIAIIWSTLEEASRKESLLCRLGGKHSLTASWKVSVFLRANRGLTKSKSRSDTSSNKSALKPG